jgi:spore maturation protein CgeB
VKVLICGSFWKGSIEQSYADAFTEIGCLVHTFDWESHELGSGRARAMTSRIGAEWIGRQLVDLAVSEMPDVIFVIKGRRIPPKTVRALKAVMPSVPLVNFNPDSPWDGRSGSRQLIESIAYYDVHFTWSRALIVRFEAASARAVRYLPFAYDPTLHRPLNNGAETRQYDAVFIGTHDPERDKLLAGLSGCRIAIWGNGWKRAKHVPKEWIKGEAVYGTDGVRCLNTGVAAINILRPQNAGSHNMRTFEIPATRNVLLTGRTAEQESFLHEGTEMLCYESPDELRQQLVALRGAPERAEAIRNSSFDRIKDQTYALRATEILHALDLRVH